MEDYIGSKNFVQDAQDFVTSQYGSYLLSVFEETAAGNLASAIDVSEAHPDRYLARYGAVKELLETIHQPLDNHKSSRG